VPIAPAAVEVLADLARVLPRWGAWYLFGAQAVIAYGIPRLSADVDVTLRLAASDASGFVEAMGAAGFELRVTDRDFVRRTRVFPFLHTPTGMPVDVVLAGSGLEDEFLSRVRTLDIGGTQVPVIDPADLVIAKVLAGRPKDIEDAKGLWSARAAELDAARIESLLHLLEEALGQSDLIPVFEAIRRRSGRRDRS
jgi:hypothetical protein